MYRLSSIGLVLLFFLSLRGQSPHGDNLKLDCAICHDPTGWSIQGKTVQFDHSRTNFELEGRHLQTACIDCHSSLVFNEAPNQCIECHTDIHNMSVGDDCARCHTSESWLVHNIPEIHEENGFALLGVHGTLSCDECHLSETSLRFDRIGNECINCHQNDYTNTSSPNHISAGYSTNCVECHSILGTGWSSENFLHDFFPLVKGHNISDCKECHSSSSFSDASPKCFSCHQSNYNATTSPDHAQVQFSTDCKECHSIETWNKATFNHDGPFFPIYSGKHRGEWNSCTDCHTSIADYSVFSCFTCHQQASTNSEHHEVSGYQYLSTKCLQCHPDGSE